MGGDEHVVAMMMNDVMVAIIDTDTELCPQIHPPII